MELAPALRALCSGLTQVQEANIVFKAELASIGERFERVLPLCASVGADDSVDVGWRELATVDNQLALDEQPQHCEAVAAQAEVECDDAARVEGHVSGDEGRSRARVSVHSSLGGQGVERIGIAIGQPVGRGLFGGADFAADFADDGRTRTTWLSDPLVEELDAASPVLALFAEALDRHLLAVASQRPVRLELDDLVELGRELLGEVLPITAAGVGTVDTSGLARDRQTGLDGDGLTGAAAECPLDERKAVDASGVRLADVWVFVRTGLFTSLKADPNADDLSGICIGEPRLEALDLGDLGADTRGARDRNLLTLFHPCEQRASVADRIAHGVDPLELDAVLVAERNNNLFNVAVGAGPLAWVFAVGVGHVAESHDLGNVAPAHAFVEHDPGIEPPTVGENLGKGGDVGSDGH